MTRRTIRKEILANAFYKHGNFQQLMAKLPNLVTLSIDSRNLEPGDIFFAIKGEFDDGHNYIGSAVDQGAALIVADATYQDKLQHLCSWPIVFVDDTMQLFSEIARIHLDSLSVTRIAITGSNGKTTTKEMIKAGLVKILGSERVFASHKNQNNHFGVPLSALAVSPEHQIAIFEMGMNHAGEIASLCAIVRPDVAIITNISFAHEGNFDDGIEGVQHAKGELFQSLASSGGHAVVNIDDARVVKEASRWASVTKTTFGCGEGADLRVIAHEPYSLACGSQKVTISVREGETITFAVPLPGAHHANNAASALAVIKALGFSVREAAMSLKDMVKTSGRMSVSLTKKGQLMIDDGYNANPASMKAGIMASRDFQAKRRVAAIGAMGELGEKSAHHHFELGQLLAANFDQLFICGALAKVAVEGAKSAGMADDRIVFRNSSTELIEPLKSFVVEGDLIFVKGSQSANMQELVSALATE